MLKVVSLNASVPVFFSSISMLSLGVAIFICGIWILNYVDCVQKLKRNIIGYVVDEFHDLNCPSFATGIIFLYSNIHRKIRHLSLLKDLLKCLLFELWIMGMKSWESPKSEIFCLSVFGFNLIFCSLIIK